MNLQGTISAKSSAISKQLYEKEKTIPRKNTLSVLKTTLFLKPWPVTPSSSFKHYALFLNF
jgi:hypothetical protein